ncbi:e9imm peptide [Streptomyces sp. NBC_01506]|uniref:e9imm peptide n=1 Tax=Streptomyces sp. NBC_01506 TaxID=2903887 RepID=UPI00386523C7
MVERIMSGSTGSEEQDLALMKELEASVPHPRVSDLIFYSDPPMSAEEVVEEALSYRPIEL